MPVVTMNRGTKVLKVDLTDSEFFVLDSILSREGVVPIERAISYLIAQELIAREEAEQRDLTDFIKRAKVGTRVTLKALMDANPTG